MNEYKLFLVSIFTALPMKTACNSIISTYHIKGTDAKKKPHFPRPTWGF